MDVKKYYGKYLLLPLLIFYHIGIVASSPGFPDTLYVKKGESLMFNDSITFFNRDTILIIPEDVAIIRLGDNYLKSKKIYDTLFTRAKSNKWKYQLYHLFFMPNGNIARNPKKEKSSTQEYSKYTGRVIRSIKFFELDPFTPIAKDKLLTPESSSASFLHKIHKTTRTKTIRYNLFFSEGDVVNPDILADNERYLRQLPSIHDVHFILYPAGNNQVDVVIITKDVFPIGAEYQYYNPKQGNILVFDNNIMGRGQKFSINIPYDFNVDHPVGSGFGYEVNNIGKSFINGKVNLQYTFKNQSAILSLQRPFINTYAKHAGGLTSSLIYKHATLNHDTVEVPLKYFYNDLWYGHSFLLNKSRRERIVFSGRYIQNNVMQRPQLGEQEYYQYQRYQLLLAKLSYSKDQYFKTRLIYNYGTTEDIPEGMLFSLTGGYEINEYGNRYYGGLEISTGKYFNRFGYLNSGIKVGGFMPRDVVNAGIFSARTNYFSRLVSIGRYYYRQFVDINFTTGINRYSEERLTINDRYGIRGLRSDSLTGIRRLAIKTEAVAFSPYYLYGFRFVFFAFADLGVIDFGNILFTDNRLYSGLGLGIRIRNENLVFSTFQIRLAYYPVLPEDVNYQPIVLSGEKQFSPYNFIPHKPSIFEFK